MIEEQVTVTRTNGDFAWVKTAPGGSGCSSCSSSGGCGVTLLSGLWKNRAETSFKARNEAGAKAGDIAMLAIPEAIFVKGAIALYLLPLGSLLACSITTKLLLEPATDLPVIAAGITGLFASLAWLRWRQKTPDGENIPTLSRVVTAKGVLAGMPASPLQSL